MTATNSSKEPPRIALRQVVKEYGALRALDGASLTLVGGRLHAVVGENGAGKSTLLKIAAGVVVADGGEVLIDGASLEPPTAREAIRRGVGMVHQHFMLVPTLNGLENLALGAEATRFGSLDLRALAARVKELEGELGLRARLDVPIEELGVGERQRLEILRVLARGARVVILDEPTAVLAPAEARAVLTLARKLARDGAAVAVVTHRLDEVTEHADEVTVLRRGRVVAHHPLGDPLVADARALAREALGDEPFSIIARRPRPRDAKRGLSLDRICVAAGEGSAPLDEVSIDVAEGEIVGIAGVEGNGQHALELAIAGLARIDRGRVRIDERDVTHVDVRGRRGAGLAWIPSDRHEHGIAAELPAADVLFLGALSEVSRSFGRVDDVALELAYARAVARLEVRPGDPHVLAGALSGGNQQKLVVARELRKTPRVLLAAQPTRGVDARVAARIRALITEVAAQGTACLVISSDLAELRQIADRIVVMRSGRVVAEVPAEAEIEAIGAAMMGAREAPR